MGDVDYGDFSAWRPTYIWLDIMADLELFWDAFAVVLGEYGDGAEGDEGDGVGGDL